VAALRTRVPKSLDPTTAPRACAKKSASDIVAALRSRLRKPAPDPIPAQETKSGWKVVAEIGGFALAVGIGVLAALGRDSASGSDSFGTST